MVFSVVELLDVLVAREFVVDRVLVFDDFIIPSDVHADKNVRERIVRKISVVFCIYKKKKYYSARSSNTSITIQLRLYLCSKIRVVLPKS